MGSLKVQVISYISNLDGVACSHHVDDRIRELASRGCEITLFTGPLSGTATGVPQRTVFYMSPRDLRSYLRTRIKRKFRIKLVGSILWKVAFLPIFPFYLLERVFPAHDSSIWWGIPAGVAAALGARRERPDVIYTSGGWNNAHVAGLIAAGMTGVPWVAEFQDPVIHGYCSRSEMEKRFLLWMERKVQEKAARVVFLTKTAAKVAAERARVGGHCTAIYPGAPAPGDLPPAGPRRGGTLVLGHVGSFAGTRNPKVFLEALAEAVRVCPALRNDLKVRFLGAYGSESEPWIGRYPHPEMLEIRGKISREEARRAMAEVDCLLLVQNTEGVSSETIPSKFYEYLYSGRPILGLIFRNPELRGMLESRNHTAVEGDDPGGIGQAVLELHSAWKAGRLRVPRWEPVSIQDASREMFGLLEAVAEPGRRARGGPPQAGRLGTDGDRTLEEGRIKEAGGCR